MFSRRVTRLNPFTPYLRAVPNVALGAASLLTGLQTRGWGATQAAVSGALGSTDQNGADAVDYSQMTLQSSSIKVDETLQTQSKEHRKVVSIPSGRASRAATFGSMMAQVGFNAAFGQKEAGRLLSNSSHEAIVHALCRMRGAVLKLGQMLSIQDEKSVPPAVTQIFERVRDQAYVMPQSQLDQQLATHVGADWQEKLLDLQEEPIAAASIGQVHRATVVDKESGASLPVAVKVQYPGVADSIDSDIANLKMLSMLHVLPPGLFVGNIMRDMQRELKEECQYTIEASKQQRYANLLAEDPILSRFMFVPKVYGELSSDRVLVSSLVKGVTVDQVNKLEGVSQDFKNSLCSVMMRLTLTELFRWRFMQTDPNFSNFLVDPQSGVVNLLDFGAAREYEADFVDNYLDVVKAASMRDRQTVIDKSIKLGFLTGRESKEMLDAHVQSVFLLGMPFEGKTRGAGFDFAANNLPEQIQKLVPIMLKLRLKPPPLPIYSLHRRISGTILICTKLGAKVDVAAVFDEIYTAAKKDRRNHLASARNSAHQ